MKKILNYIIILGLTFCVFTACEEMDSTYKDFVVPGGLVYAGKVSSPLVYAGKHRIKISWLRGSDPNVIKARVYWNNKADSIDVPYPENEEVISVILNDLEEKSYSFVVKTYDINGNTSIPVELFGGSYGARYQTGIQALSRPVKAANFFADGKVTIEWSAANISGGAYATEVEYVDGEDKPQVKRFPADELISTLPSVKAGTDFDYKTLYLPDSLSIDTFYTDIVTNAQYRFDKSTWEVVSYSSQHNTAAENVATNFIDGSPATRWHTLSNSSAKYPHFIVVDMKTEKTISGFEVFRMDADVRGCSKFQLLVSNDNATWTDLGQFDFDYLSNAGQFYETPSKPKARYFRFVGLQGPNGFMVMGEIDVYGM